MWKLITTIMMVLLALAGRSEAQGSSHTDEEAVRINADAWMAAWNNGDAHAIAQLVTEDYEVVWPDGTHNEEPRSKLRGIRSNRSNNRSELRGIIPIKIKGRGAYEKGLASNFARRQATPTLSAMTVFVRFLKADVAVASGTWTRSGGAAGPGKGSWLATYTKQGGQWLIASGVAAAAPQPPTIKEK